MTSTHTIPDRLVQDGNIYTLAVHRDDPVQLNVAVPCHVREGIRLAAAAQGMTMQELVAEVLADFLADAEQVNAA